MTPGQLGPISRHGLASRKLHGAGHVEHGNALGDGDDDGDAGVGGFQDGVGGAGRRHEDHRGVGAGLAHRLGDGVEQGKALLVGAALAGRDAADDLGAVVAALLAWKVPALPRPWQMTRVFLSTRMLMEGQPLPSSR